MKVAERVKQIDSVDYELAVRDEIAGYFGSWFCRECWQGGVKYELLPNADDAMAQAERGAEQHHASEHNSSEQRAMHNWQS